MTLLKALQRSLFGGGFGLLLASAGIFYDTWKFWVLFIYVLIWTWFSHEWGVEDTKKEYARNAQR